MLDELQGRLAVISGAGSGIGQHLAFRLHRLGMRLALLDVDPKGLARTVEQITGNGTVRSYMLDIGDQAAVDSMAADVVGTLGVPRLLLNSAGRLGPFAQRAWEYTNAEWQDLLAVNLYGPINLVRAFLPGMIAVPEPSHVCVIASAAGLIPGSRTAPYFASKHAAVAFAENLELELAAMGSRVSVSLVCPGAVRTNINIEMRQTANVTSPSSDWLEPEQVAEDIIQAIQRDQFYVFTHASSRQRLINYQQRVLAGFEGKFEAHLELSS